MILVKKDTLQLQNYETSLLNYYRLYLKKMEKICSGARKKSFNIRSNECELELGKLAIQRMCDILNMHHYFNYSANIANFLTPFLNSKYSDIRITVFNSFKKIFKEDKRGELTLTVITKVF